MGENPVIGWEKNTPFAFDEATKEAYRTKDPKSIYNNEDVYIYEKNNNIWQCKIDDLGKVCMTEVDQFAYMDVGLWGGDGPTGDTATAWERHRDFGLVSGNAAILCKYDKKSSGKNPIWPQNIDKRVIGHPAVKKTEEVLQKLSGSNELGPVTVVGAVIVPGNIYEDPTDGLVQVYLGDIHAPVMDEISQTRLPGLPSFKPLPQGSSYSGWRINTALLPKCPLITAKSIIDAANALSNVTVDKPDEIISTSEAVDWFNLYHGTPSQKGADIFQSAGGDLMKFLDLLMAYQSGARSSPDAKLIQLGDLYDFWIGLKRAFKTIPNEMINIDLARGFVGFWRSKTMERPYIKKLIEDTVSLNPVFVYGNHDNYRHANSSTLIDPKDPNWNKKVVWYWEDSPPGFRSTGVRAEHGHQDDQYNKDSSATTGWGLTQVAFFYPDVRKIIGGLRSTGELWGLTTNERLTYIRRAATLCREPTKQPKLRIYVQGHTHEPFIKLVRIKEVNDRP